MELDVYGKLAVIDWSQSRRATVVCKCGVQKQVQINHLRSGMTISCGGAGCKERKHKRRNVDRKTYRAWTAMHKRCRPGSIDYENYGGRGITVSDEWRSYERFLADMGVCPPGKSLDRIDNDGNYEVSNCRWADRAIQNRNKRSNVHVRLDGKEMVLIDAAYELGMTRWALTGELARKFSRIEFTSQTGQIHILEVL